MTTYYIYDEAREEYRDAAPYYKAKEGPALAAQFQAEVIEGINTILEAPDRYQLITLNVRRFPLHRFPYRLFYTINAEENVLEIIAIAHTSRRPFYWIDRLT